jgi:MORN repeat
MDRTNTDRQSIKPKLGMALAAAVFFELVGGASLPSRAIAQTNNPASERPPICQPSVLSGFTRCNYAGGDNYVGYVVNGLPNGRGTFVYSGGNRYEGEFRNGLPNGRGRFVFQDDARYEGTFSNGVFISGRAMSMKGPLNSFAMFSPAKSAVSREDAGVLSLPTAVATRANFLPDSPLVEEYLFTLLMERKTGAVTASFSIRT